MKTLLSERLLTLDEYHRMIEVGILGEDDHLELLAGKLVLMSPIGSRHSTAVNRLAKILIKAVPSGLEVSTQNPIQIPNHSEPEPDLAILQGSFDTFATRHPLPVEVLLVVEVADTTLEKDQKVKLPLYAAAGIPTYWIVDLENRQIQVHTAPQNELYAQRRLYEATDNIHLPILSIDIAVSDIIGA